MAMTWTNPAGLANAWTARTIARTHHDLRKLFDFRGVSRIRLLVVLGGFWGISAVMICGGWMGLEFFLGSEALPSLPAEFGLGGMVAGVFKVLFARYYFRRNKRKKPAG